MLRKLLAVAFAASLGAFAGPASAIQITFDLNDYDSRDGELFSFWGESAYAKTYNYASDGLNLSITGWSYGLFSDNIESSYVGNWEPYGLGVELSLLSPDHAVDNYRGDYDMLLLSFDQAIELDAITSGWQYNDSDTSIMAYTGGPVADVTDAFAGNQWQDLLLEGWSFVGDYYNIGSSNTSVNSGGLTSQYWLIGAYNQHLGGPSGITTSNDFFKLKSATVSVNPVPLPGSLLLFGTALLWFGSVRRKQKAAK